YRGLAGKGKAPAAAVLAVFKGVPGQPSAFGGGAGADLLDGGLEVVIANRANDDAALGDIARRAGEGEFPGKLVGFDDGRLGGVRLSHFGDPGGVKAEALDDGH